MQLDTLDKRGRLVVPAHIREQLGLAAGMLLIVEEGDAGDAVLHSLGMPAPPPPFEEEVSEAQVVEKEGVLVVQTTPIEDLDAFIAHEREQRLRAFF